MNKQNVRSNRINTDGRISKSNRTNMRLLITTSIVLSVFLVLSGTVSAAEIPPNKFSGNVTLNGADASIGTVIDAYIGGELRGSVTVTTVGKYVQLPVDGNESDEDAQITFMVCGATADQTAEWHEMNEPRILDLTAVDNEAPEVTNPEANPTSIVADGVSESQLSVTVIDGCSHNIDSVTVDLSAIGGSDAQEMTHIGGTDVYTVITNVSEGTAPGTYCLQVTASDVFENYDDSVCIDLEVTTEAGLPKTGDIDGSGGEPTMSDAVYLAKHVVGLSGYETIY